MTYRHIDRVCSATLLESSLLYARGGEGLILPAKVRDRNQVLSIPASTLVEKIDISSRSPCPFPPPYLPKHLSFPIHRPCLSPTPATLSLSNLPARIGPYYAVQGTSRSTVLRIDFPISPPNHICKILVNTNAPPSERRRSKSFLVRGNRQ